MQKIVTEDPYRKCPMQPVAEPLLSVLVIFDHDGPFLLIAVLLPELVVKHWWQNLLHNQRAQVLKHILLVRGNQRIIVINIPWYL